MPVAHDIQGTVFKNGTAVFLARVVGDDGQLLTPGQLASAAYSISLLDDSDPDAESPVAGHTAAPLDVADVMFAALQLDALWDIDATGYNFRHALDVTSQPAFAIAGLPYRVRYELTPASGQTIVIRFRLRAL